MATVTIDERKIPQTQYATPTTGGTIAVNSNGYVNLVINPAGSLLALTINFPSNPQDGDTVNFSSTQIVTTLTMNNGTFIGALTSLVVGSFGYFIYSSDAGKWMRMG
jgi:hypothetical protein